MSANQSPNKPGNSRRSLRTWFGGATLAGSAWINEKEGTEVPVLLRVCYVAIASSAVAYLILYMYAETSHAGRGPLMRQSNLSTFTSEPLMYAVAVLVAMFFVVVSLFAARKDRPE